jgi:CBS domain-containing membrane protein
LQRWLPSPATANRREQFRAAGGALLGIMLTALLSQALLQSTHAHQPGRADRRPAVLLFALPASPLAQPWSVIGGNVVSGLVGVACVRWLGHSLPCRCWPLAAARQLPPCLPCAACPPGGAVALTR